MPQWRNLMGKIDLFVYGAGGHGKVVHDIAIRNGFSNIKFIDDDKNKKDVFGYEEFLSFYKDVPVALGIGNNRQRFNVFKKLLKDNINVITVIDPSSVIGTGVKIGKGVVIMPNVVINADTVISDGAILNSASVVEHDNFIGSFVHISPNSALAGGVMVGDFSHIGIGAVVLPNIKIGKNVVVGAGAVVTKEIEDMKKVAGVPAKEIKGSI
jgi:UDP-N-acetylbacillosamine N-acetyltransferase